MLKMFDDDDAMFSASDGVNLFYHHAGEGRTAVIFLHGRGGSTVNWRVLLDHMNIADLSLVSMDPAWTRSVRAHSARVHDRALLRGHPGPGPVPATGEVGATLHIAEPAPKHYDRFVRIVHQLLLTVSFLPVIAAAQTFTITHATLIDINTGKQSHTPPWSSLVIASPMSVVIAALARNLEGSSTPRDNT